MNTRSRSMIVPSPNLYAMEKLTDEKSIVSIVERLSSFATEDVEGEEEKC